MKFSENSLVVDVIKITNSSFKLSVPAGDLLTAAMNGAALRRHDLSTASVPNVLYVPLSEAKLSSGTYTFTFASGDAFTASSADAYPEASSVSDNTDSELPTVGENDKNKFLHTNESTGALEWAEGGSGGGALVVHDVDGALDKTYKQIVDALHANGVILEWTHEDGSIEVYWVSDYGNVDSVYNIAFHTDSSISSAAGNYHYYSAESENGYPTNDD